MLVASFAEHSYSPFVIVSHTISTPSPNIFGVNKRAIGLPPIYWVVHKVIQESIFFYLFIYIYIYIFFFSTPLFEASNSNPIE